MSKRMIRLITLVVIMGLTLSFNLHPQTTASAATQPPSFLDLWPEAGVELKVNEPITLTFDQPMDHAATEAAIRFNPSVAGIFTWSDAQTLVFTPRGGWQDKTQLTIQNSARAITGLTLISDSTFTLRTEVVAALRVTGTVPEADAMGAALDSKIAVSFDRPVVPLMPAQDSDTQPAPFTIEPAVAGSGRWIDTTTYVFTPTEPLAGGTKYTLTIPAGFEAIDGSTLAQSYVSIFQTAYPQVDKIEPSGGHVEPCDQSTVALDCSITVSFSEAVDPVSAQAAFSLIKSGSEPVQGTTTFSADDKQLIFTPATRFDYDTSYKATVADSALNKARTAKIAQTESISLQTIPSPSLFEIRDENTGDSETGDAEFYFNTLMLSSSVKDHIKISPTPDNLTIQLAHASDEAQESLEDIFYVTFTMKPGVQYEARLLPGAEDAFGTKIQRNSSSELKVYTDPNANLNAAYPILNGSIMMIDASDAHYSIMAQGQTTVKTSLYQLTPTVFDQYGLTNVEFGEDCNNSLAGYGDSPYGLTLPKPDKPLQSWQQSFNDSRGAYTRHEIPLSDSGAMAPGLYMVHMDAPYNIGYGPDSDFVLIAATASLTVKSTEHEIFVWVTDLKTAQPLPNVPVALYYRGNSHILGQTNAQGIVQGSLDFTSRSDDELNGQSTQVYVVAQMPGVFGAWYSCYATEEIQRTRKDFLYTDRPIYRPGETVNVKGILRNRADMDFSPANVKTVSLTLSDASQTQQTTTATVNRDGTYTAAFTLPDSAAIGTATIAVDDPTAGTTDERGLDTSACPDIDYYYANEPCSYVVSFTIAAFRAPEIQVAVNTEQPEIIQGDPLNFDVAATFYSGGAVGNTAIDWKVYATPTFFNYTGSGDYTFDDERWYTDGYYDDEYNDFGNQTQDEGTAATDSTGKQQIQSSKTSIVNQDPSTLDEPAPSSPPTTLTAEATVSDSSAGPVSAHTAPVIAHPANVYVGISAKQWDAVAGQPTQLNFITVHPDSTAAGYQPIELHIARVTWTRINENIFHNPDWQETITVIHSDSLTSDANGAAAETFTPGEPGTYRIEAITKDARGRVASATLRIYVTDKSYSSDIYWGSPQSAITPVADKKSYKPGDTALIQVPTGFVESSVMLVTVERGSVLWSDVVKLDTPSPTYKLPILDEFAPGAMVDFTIYRAGKPDFRYGEVQINVEPMAKRLNVQLKPSTTMTNPHGTVSFDVLVTDEHNKPVQAEVSLALVDKSVLALVDPNTPTLEGYFYDSASIKNYVQTTLSQFGYIPLQSDSYIVPCCFGGGGGGPNTPPSPAIYIRSNFKYTALWSPFVTTDADGKASVQVTLPDNATTWSLDARAVTATTQVGQGTTELLATMPLLIRPVVPRFFIAGDKVQLSAIVNNNTGKDETATVKIDSSGVTLNSPIAQQVKIAAGQYQRVTWDVTVNDAPHADFTFTVIDSNGVSDASKPTLSINGDGTIPIYQYVAYDNAATSGALLQPGSQSNAMYIPPSTTPVSGQVTVALQSSLAAVSLDSLNYLQAFAHDCIEQTVSKFLPNAVTLNALKTLNISNPSLEQQLQQGIYAAKSKLEQAQNADGGWGWFPQMQTDPLVTAYAILAGTIAGGDQDLHLNDAVARLGKEVSQPNADTSSWMLDRQAFYTYVLVYADNAATYGLSDSDRMWATTELQALFAYHNKMDYAAEAYLLMAFNTADPKADAVTTLLGDLLSAAHRTATTAFWKETYEDDWNWNTDTRTTALALKAILQVKPDDPILPLAVRWLVDARHYDHWETTQETAWAVMALTDWMAYSHELEGDFSYDIKLGSTALLSGTVSGGKIDDINKLQIDVQKFLSDQASLLTVDRGDGQGALYYTTDMQLYVPASQARAVDRGVVIKREYLDGGNPITKAKVGDVITVRLTFTTEEDMHYFVLEDPFPAGIEAINTNFNTTSLGADEPSLDRIFDNQEYRGWGWWYIDRVELRDQQMNLYASYLPQGTYTFTYQVRATFPGVFQVKPADGYPFYQPDHFGRSEGATLTIVEATDDIF